MQAGNCEAWLRNQHECFTSRDAGRLGSSAWAGAVIRPAAAVGRRRAGHSAGRLFNGHSLDR